MRILLVGAFLALFALKIVAQPTINSPYSRFGLGQAAPNLFASQAGMGGQTAAFTDPFHLNMDAPASLASLRSTAFEVGVNGQRSNQKTRTASLEDWRGGLNYLALGFPLRSPINEVLDKKKHKWATGMGMALVPLTQVGYSIQSPKIQPGVGAFTNEFEGEGGLYQFRAAYAAKKGGFSAGLGAGFTFGRFSYEQVTFLTDDTLSTSFINDFQDEFSVRGASLRPSVQWQKVLKKNQDGSTKESFTLGASAVLPHRLSASGDQLFIRARNRTASGGLSLPDTVLAPKIEATKIQMPAELTLGAMWQKTNKLKLGAQIGWAGWSNFENPIRPDTLKNSFSVSAGIEWTPNWLAFDSYLKKMRYRAGAFYRKDPRSVGGEQIDDLGVSLGLGLPITLPRQGTSFVNLAFEFGKLGRSAPISDGYIRATVGFTMNDNTWFYKRRFE